MSRKKERKGSDNKEKLNSVKPEVKAGVDDKEKGLYLIQIEFLNEELERFQIKCDKLEKQNQILICQYSTLDTEKKDITEYLKHSLSEKDKELDEVLEQLEVERLASIQEKHSLQLEHSRLRQELQARVDKLTEKNAALGVCNLGLQSSMWLFGPSTAALNNSVEKLADLEEFQRQKDDLMTNMESLEKQLERQKKERKEEIHSLEMKALLEKRRLEKEMESEVAAMSEKVQHLVDQRLPETTRSVLQENTELKTRFSQLSEVAKSLLEENTALREHKRQLSIDTDILEQMVRETSRISCVRKKKVQQLTGELQQLQEDITEKQQHLEQLETEHARVLAEMEALRLDRASLSAEWSRNRLERNQLEVKLKEERRRRNRMKSIMQDAANSLRQALKEAPTEQQDEDSVPRWRQLLQNLQELLDRQTLSRSSAEGVSDLQKSDPAPTR
ncbi:hypothetical protein CRENBAI_008196 [Crenichthys baileyi]|uniref:Cilia- and flagella-associated protein 157 n=1 Tax=Crenichthys baileyi TaxID=28760 RepID=A0AAV9R3H3_9TELE